MIIRKMFKLILKTFFLYSILFTAIFANQDFDQWLMKFQIKAVKSGISENVVKDIMSNAKFLPKVIEYDRFQPEFYEDTKTYIKKRTSKTKLNSGINFYKNNRVLIDNVESEFNIEKELLLSLMGIETNFGTYVGKMDILSSLATLSFDKRRS